MTNKWNSSGSVTWQNSDILFADDLNDTLVVGTPPIGAIVAWDKDRTGVPSIPSGWVECNGSTLSDANSPLNGEDMPALNGENRYLYGGDTSGSTGGQLQHTHALPNVGGVTKDNLPEYATSAYTHSHLLGSTTHSPPYYNVVWIIRIK